MCCLVFASSLTREITHGKQKGNFFQNQKKSKRKLTHDFLYLYLNICAYKDDDQLVIYFFHASNRFNYFFFFYKN